MAEVPQPRSFQVFICPHCPHAHVQFFDAQDKPLLEWVTSEETAEAMLKQIQHAIHGDAKQ